MKFHLFLPFFPIIVFALSCSEKRGFIESVMRESGKFELILDNIEKYKVQIIYTRIDRDSVGYPFMRDLGRLFYEYELKRDRQYKPDLSKYNWRSWKE